MDAKFTPGPWEYQRQDTGVGPSHMVTAQDDAGTYAVCEIHEDCKMDERAPNAKLIAAAPDMYEALKGILESGESGNIPIEILQPAINALAKVQP